MQVNVDSPITPTVATSGLKRMISAAREFESVMLNQWLQSAESSFGAAPDGSEDDDQGGQQMKSFATQQLAGQLAAHGGIGLAKLVQAGLAKVHDAAHESVSAGRSQP